MQGHQKAHINDNVAKVILLMYLLGLLCRI